MKRSRILGFPIVTSLFDCFSPRGLWIGFAILTLVGICSLAVAAEPATEGSPKLSDQAESPITIKVLVLNFDPWVGEGGDRLRLHKHLGWNDPRQLARQYQSDLLEATQRLVRHQVVRWIDLDEIPVKRDQFRYSLEDYLRLHQQRDGWHQPDQVDYRRIIVEHGLVAKVDRGEIDEVWLFGGPYFGYWESTMAGPGAFHVNSPPVEGIASQRRFVIMGFNYERGTAEMLHSLCHRVESTMAHFSGGWQVDKLDSNWARFAANASQSNGHAGCGTCHYPPNAERDYDYANERFVQSTADDWLQFPKLTGKQTRVNRETWGGPDYHRNYLRWWYARFPRASGQSAESGMQNNWWKYVYQFNQYQADGGPR